MKQLEPTGTLSVEYLGEVIVIRPEGACDDECAQALEGIIRQIEAEPEKDIILDASKLQYIETPGFRWIVNHFRRLQTIGRSLVVAGLAGPAERAFRLLQLDKFVPSVKSVDAAIAKVKGEDASQDNGSSVSSAHLHSQASEEHKDERQHIR